MTRCFPAALLLLATSARAQQAPASPSQPRTASISGTILCDDTHAPARGASVWLVRLDGEKTNNQERHFTRTDINGHFAFKNLGAGEYFPTALFAGYIPPLDTIPASDGPESVKENNNFRKRLEQIGTVTLSAGASATHDITLEHGAMLSGRVVYADGAPAAMLTLVLETVKTDKQPLGKVDWAYQENTTDDQGRFRIVGLKKGTFRLGVIPALQQTPTYGEQGTELGSYSGKAPGLLTIYSGDTYHRAAAKLFTLTPGDEVSGVDITIPLGSLHMVQGALAGKDGRPVNVANLTLSDTTDDSIVFVTRPTAGGMYSFGNVPPGTYKLSITDAFFATQDTPGSTNFQRAYKPTDRAIIVTDTDADDVNFSLEERPIKSEDAASPVSMSDN